jgi:hypothetical protein
VDQDTNGFKSYVRVRATNGSDYYLTYVPKNGWPSVDGIYAIIRVGTQYKDGTWQELNRDLDADLQAAPAFSRVRAGGGVRQVVLHPGRL